jgi:TRAP transporter 4TM/12TM fusion protein
VSQKGDHDLITDVGRSGEESPGEEFHEHGRQRTLAGWALRAVMAAALVFSTYQLLVAAFSPLSSQVTRSLHVGFLLLLTFLLYPATRKGDNARLAWWDAIIAVAAFVLGFYHWVFEADLIQRAGDPTTIDLAVGIVVVVMVFEAVRRVMGLALPIICGLFLAYGLWGQYLPDMVAHRAFAWTQIVEQLYLGTEGIYGTPILVSATYIFLFILFGSFLEHAGMIRLFNNVALGLVGGARGGPAKVAVISSGFMGTISGSGVANVLTVGQFTIPLMKRFGYSAKFAGAVEATSSMGGQIMPPVMGAVAFIMAETLNLPYVEICKAATIPAILYYVTAFWMVHLEAGRAHLMGLPKDQLPSALGAIRDNWYLLLPLAALVFMLFDGFTPMFAGMTGLTLTAILILGATVAASLGGTAFRVFFWVAMGAAGGVLAQQLSAGNVRAETVAYVVSGVLLALAAVNLFVKGGRATLVTMRDGMIDGAKQALPVGLACAIVGVIIGILTLTGAASSFAGFILDVGAKSLFASLFLTMIVCLLLGMGIPTIPNYIITSSIAAPALLKLGVPLLVSHMFVFYFGIMADLTPPVALAALAAASIAKESYMKIGWKATQIAIAGFVIPYMAVYDPSLMLQGGHWYNTVYMVFKALVAIGLWGAAAIGFLQAPLSWLERIACAAGALLLVVAVPLTDELGFAVGAVFLVLHTLKARRLAAAAA